MYRLNYCQPGALPPFRAFALTAREGLVALPRVSLPSVAGPGLQALPPAEVEGWPSAILNAAYGAYTMETICGTTHCDCLPDSNRWEVLLYCRPSQTATNSQPAWEQDSHWLGTLFPLAGNKIPKGWVSLTTGYNATRTFRKCWACCMIYQQCALPLRHEDRTEDTGL